METNQKTNPIILFSILFVLSSGIFCFGQNETDGARITQIIRDGDSTLTKSDAVVIYNPNADNKKIELIEKNKTFVKYGSMIKVPYKTEIYLKEGDKKIFNLKGSAAYKFERSSGQLLDDEEENEFIGNMKIWISKAFGNFFAFGKSRKKHLRTVKTEFEIFVNKEGDVGFKLIEGKVAINEKIKVQIEDEELAKLLVLEDNLKDSLEKPQIFNRLLYSTETTEYLTSKNQESGLTDNLKERNLTTEQEINKFFNNQLNLKRRYLSKSGNYSKAGYKNLEKGLLIEGIKDYGKAIENGEIIVDEFIESALILTEAYFRNGDLKQRKVWMDAAISVTKKEDSINERMNKFFGDMNENNIADVYLEDRALDNEYLAWAYTLKLMINGCLEVPEENPRIYIGLAKKFRKKLEIPKN